MHTYSKWMRCALAVIGLCAFISGCKDPAPGQGPDAIGDGGGIDGGSPDGGAPDAGPGADGGPHTSDGVGFIDYTLPAPNAEAVPQNTRILVAFAEALDATSVGPDSLTVTENGVRVAGTVTHDVATRSLAFTPARPFAADTLATVTVSPELRMVTGKSLPAPYVFVFSVGLTADTTAPRVRSTLPVNGESPVPTGHPVYVVDFEEPMDPRTLTSATIRFEQKLGDTPAVPLTGTITYEPLTQAAYFRVSPAPAQGALVTGTVSAGQVKDLAGNGLTTAFVFKFVVALSPDRAAPRVMFVLPEYQAVGVSARVASASVTFNEALRPSSVTVESFLLEEMNELGTQALQRVSGTARYDDARRTAHFVPAAPLKYQTHYRATVRAMSDLAGNLMVSAESFHFVTELPPTPPMVVSALPVPDMRFVSLSSPLRVRFDRPLDPATVNTTTFGVAGVTGLVNYEASTNTAAFRPVPSFQEATPYTVTVKDVRTPQGASLATPYTYSIRTVASGGPVSGSVSGQPSSFVFATGPLGTLAIWNEDTGLGIQVRAAFDNGTGFSRSTLLGRTDSVTRIPQVVAWGNRFAVSWVDALIGDPKVMSFDGTAFAPLEPGTRDRLLSASGHLFGLSGVTFRTYTGTQWATSYTSGYLGTDPTFLGNGDSVLVVSGPAVSSKVMVVYDGARWSESVLSTSAEAHFIPVGDTFGRAWVSTRGTEFALFNRATGQWGSAELISATRADAVRIASDGNTVTAVFGHANGLFAANRVSGTWQPEVTIDARFVKKLWGLVLHRGNYLALWSGSTTTEIRATSQTGGSWASATSVVVASGVSRVRAIHPSGDDLFVLTDKDDPLNFGHYEAWSTALTAQGWQPSVRLRESTDAPVNVIPLSSGAGVAFAAPGQLTQRAYQSGGQWAEARPLVAPEPTGSVRETSVDFAADGTGVAAWEQFDGGKWSIFLAEFDGTSWLEPVRVARNVAKPRAARSAQRSVVAYQREGSTGKVDMYVVSHEAGTLGTPTLVESMTATLPDLLLVHGAGGFLLAWGDWEIRSSLSLDGLTWAPPVNAIPRVYDERWHSARLDAVGSSFVATARRRSYTDARVHTGGAWAQTTQEFNASHEMQFVNDGTSLVMTKGYADALWWIAYDGAGWLKSETMTPGLGGYAFVANSPQGLRLHSGMAWWTWGGSDWVQVAASSRPDWDDTGTMRCDTKGCGAVSAVLVSESDAAPQLVLSYAAGTGAFLPGASPGAAPASLMYGVSWDYEAGTYRASWRQTVEPQVYALHASTNL